MKQALRLTGLVALVSITLGCIVAIMSPHIARADGGAPNLAYVAGGGQGISVIDVSQQKVTKTIKLGGDPHTILLSLDGSTLFVTQPASNKLSVMDTRDDHTICSANVPVQPSLLAYDPDTRLLYTGGRGGKGVYEINSTTCAIESTIETEGKVYGLALARVSSGGASNIGNQLWVASEKHVTIYDLKQRKQIGSIEIADGPQYLSIPPGTTVYVNTRAGNIQTIDLATHKVSQILTGGDFGPMDYDETTGEMYVPDRSKNQLLVLTPVHSGFQLPKEPGRVIKLAEKPQSVAITSDGQLGFIALANGKVDMLDIPGRQIITTLDVGGKPQFIITGLYPPAMPQNTTPSLWSTLPGIIAYVVIALIIIGIPLLLMSRRQRAPHKR
ncbi:YncE family protein [Ktedonospora formicarum]|nr:YncE family protein [Ktedonospora formicarum]